MKPLPEPLLWDVQQTSAAIGMSIRTVQGWTAAGKLPGFVAMNGHPRWQRAVIEQWIADGCRTTQIHANEETDIDCETDSDILPE